MTTASKPPRTRVDHELTATLADIHAEWRKHALCAGRDMYPAPGSYHESWALSICGACPVEGECARWALGLHECMDPGGVVGGMTEKQRLHLNRSATTRAGMAKTGTG